MEKIHGTSAHISWRNGETVQLRFFSGGCNYENFVKLFNQEFLTEKFKEIGVEDIIVFGEAYGGKLQGMSHTYGKDLKFVAFDVKIGDCWLNVPKAEAIAKQLGLEFVHYVESSTDIEELDKLRDSTSIQGVRNGVNTSEPAEGIVLRPLEEFRTNNGERVIAKHKNDLFKEREHQPKVTGEKLEILTETNKVADEWVTEMRLSHILGKMQSYSINDTPEIIKTMIEDVSREAKGEIIENKDVRKAIGKKTAIMFKQRLQDALHANTN